ncbi:4Fe-4S dicluster domain-containing protein [Metallumcola ferriviriculae]|uniref:4Fe-4S dicluster domain-containing protein n=1 Tax=Metallumcola ferriviriculae TaxID=3039180 RepID=A0AAU0UKL7_9FIRM|nr:4Fe-4S dicluster domain-containing protein [Desulfitibacteraceae bacterium MK1]
MTFIIAKERITSWLRKLIKQGILVAPVSLANGDVIFKELLTPDNILLEYDQPLFSPKNFFFPQQETLFKFTKQSPQNLEAIFDKFPRVFFGLRPCDVKALNQADVFFSEYYPDPYYSWRRKRTLIITNSCTQPLSRCFCNLMGCSPSYQQGSDVFLLDIGDVFLATAHSEKGEKAIETFRHFFAEADICQLECAKHLVSEAEATLENHIPASTKIPDITQMPSAFWEKISKRCFSCGSCSYNCPLCFCYNIVDRADGSFGKRIRTWDSCIFEGFSRMAGGHNLDKNKAQRLQKRFTHKLKLYPEKYNTPGCTGCGRCSSACLGRIGMKEVLQAMDKEVSGDAQK